jgi:drug/metabolite transporter (DMT)-like permease
MVSSSGHSSPTPLNQHAVPYLLFLFVCLCWGTSFILMDRAGHAFGPAAIGVGRMLCGAATLAIYCIVTRRWIRLSRLDWLRLTFVAVLANSWPYVIQPYVMQQAGEHGFFGMMVMLVPIATIAASAIMLQEWPTSRQSCGVLGGLICATLIVSDGTGRGMPLWLLALSMSTPISYAIGNTFMKWKLDHLPTAQLSTLFLLIATIFVLPVMLTPLGKELNLAGPDQPRDWWLATASLLALGVGSTGVAILAFVHLVQTQGPLFAGMVTYVVPMIAICWGQLDGERLTTQQLGAIAAVLGMVALVQWGAAKPPELAGEPPA